MGWFGFIIFVIVVITSVAAWVNTKIIIEELEIIKKHLGIPEDESISLHIAEENEEENNQTQ
ncbi:MAG: hypothetical protein PHT78_13745 [Desulfitobacteriaceae bacterium]|nr:hypothetical protein [Desulfitobacteriaceae bacterium]